MQTPRSGSANGEENHETLRLWIERHERELERALRPLGRLIADERGQSGEETGRELLDETVRRALTDTDRYDPLRPPLGWLLGIARHILLQWRDEITRDRRRQVPLTCDSEDADVFYSRLGQCAPGPEGAVAERDWLAQLLDGVSPEDREIITAYAEEELDTAAVAQRLDISPAAARVRLCRARKRLRASNAALLSEGVER